MKKKAFILLCVLLVLLLSVYAVMHRGRMLKNASPRTSGMALYYFDGENTTIKRLFDRDREREIIRGINRLRTRTLDPARAGDISVPCYGLEIGGRDGSDIRLTYSDGLWLLKDGTVYSAEYDFAALYDSIQDTDAESCSGGLRMPNSAILGQYDARFYEKSAALSGTKDGVSMSFVSFENNIVTVRLQNDSKKEFLYGTPFSLQKKIDGEWYTLPVRLSNYSFTSIGLILRPKQSADAACDLTGYGKLESGLYRVVKEGIAAEFEIKTASGG